MGSPRQHSRSGSAIFCGIECTGTYHTNLHMGAHHQISIVPKTSLHRGQKEHSPRWWPPHPRPRPSAPRRRAGGAVARGGPPPRKQRASPKRGASTKFGHQGRSLEPKWQQMWMWVCTQYMLYVCCAVHVTRYQQHAPTEYSYAHCHTMPAVATMATGE